MKSSRSANDVFPAPDGGFGWVIVFAAFMQHVIALGISYSIGVYYPYLIDTFQVSKTTAAWVAALHLCMLYAIGPVLGWLTDRIGTTGVSFVGSVAAGIGCIGASYSSSIYLIIFFLGFVSGSGSGLMFMSGVTAVSRWFGKKRSLATGLAVSGAGLGMFFFAPLVRLLQDEYGGPGALLIEGGLAFQGCVFALLLRPLPSADVKSKRLQNQVSTMQIYNTKPPGSSIPEEAKPLNQHTKQHSTPLPQTPGIWSIMPGLIFWIFALSQFLAFLCASGPLVFLYNRAVHDLSIDPMNAAYVISMLGAANTVGRLFFGALGSKFPGTTFYLLSGAIIAVGLATAVSTLGTSYWSISLYSIVFGAFYGCFFAILSVVLVDYFGLAQFGSVYGNLGLFRGLACIIGPPFGGWLIASTGNNHSTLFIVNGILGLAGGLVLLIIPLVSRLKSQKIAAKSSVEKEFNLTV